MGEVNVESGFKVYDAAEYLKSESEKLLYLEACFEEAGDDASYIASALGDIARAKGMSDIAAATGLTREGLYRTLSKDGNPSFSAILKVMKALGVEVEAVSDLTPFVLSRIAGVGRDPLLSVAKQWGGEGLCGTHAHLSHLANARRAPFLSR